MKTMKNFIRLAGLILVAVCLTGCNEPEEVSATEFQAMLERNPETMRHTEFMGVKDGKAILKVSTMSSYNQEKWSDELFFTDASKLPSEWLDKQDIQSKRKSEQ
jgi:uncharacterized lipoprotein YajG